MTGFNRDDLRRLDSLLVEELLPYGSIKRLPKGYVLWFKGEINRVGLVLIHDGLVKLSDYTPDGRRLTLAFLGKGEILGDISLVTGLPHSLTVEAYTEIEVKVISRKEFYSLLDGKPQLWELLAKKAMLRLYSLTERYLMALRGDTMMRLKEITGSLRRLNLELPHHELASLLGVSRETVTRLLRKMERL